MPSELPHYFLTGVGPLLITPDPYSLERLRDTWFLQKLSCGGHNQEVPSSRRGLAGWVLDSGLGFHFRSLWWERGKDTHLGRKTRSPVPPQQWGGGETAMQPDARSLGLLSPNYLGTSFTAGFVCLLRPAPQQRHP